MVELGRDVDADFVRLAISERVAGLGAELPSGVVGPSVEPYVPEQFREQRQPLLTYSAAGPYTDAALRDHVERIIAPELRRVEGVAAVVARGGPERVVEIEVDRVKAGAMNVDIATLERVIGDVGYRHEAVTVQERGVVRALIERDTATSPERLLDVTVQSKRGHVVRVGDVAVVHDTYEARSLYRTDGLAAVAFDVQRAYRTNAVAVADRAKTRVADLARRLPTGMVVVLDDDESAAIRAQFDDLRSRSLVSAAIIFTVLFAFLRSLRSAAIVFTTIAFSVLITLNVIYFAGMTLNVLTLLGLAMGFGTVIDTAIVVFENIYRRWRAGESADVAAERGTREVTAALVVSTATTIAVFIPFVYVQGELRVFYVPLALVTGLSQVAGLVVSITLIPTLAARVLDIGPPSSRRRSTAQPRWYVVVYGALVRHTLRVPWLTVAVALVVLAWACYEFDRNVPRGRAWGLWETDTYLVVDIALPRGEEMERTDELARHFERVLRRFREVKRFTTTVSPQSARIRVTFPDSLNDTAAPLAIKDQLTAEGFRVGGAEVRITGFGPSFSSGDAGSPSNYSIAVLGYRYQTVREIADALGRRLALFPRIREVDINATESGLERDRASEIVVRLDRTQLATHALTAADVSRYVAAAVGGASGSQGTVRVAGAEIPFVVKLSGSSSMDVRQLRDLLLPAGGGSGVRLGDVADVAERGVLGRIVREDQQYRRLVSYEFLGPQQLGDRVQDAVMASTHLPDGYRLDRRDKWRWEEDDIRQLYWVLGASLLLIFIITAALFESIVQPVCVLLTVPMALIGVFLLFWWTRASFTREAYVGVIMMSGVVVNSAILLVDRVNQLRTEKVAPLGVAVEQGTLQRVRPILMTNLSAVLGLLPLVLVTNNTDAYIWNALGLAMIGGLCSSTVLVLAVTPAIYLLIERRRDRSAP